MSRHTSFFGPPSIQEGAFQHAAEPPVGSYWYYPLDEDVDVYFFRASNQAHPWIFDIETT